MAWEYWGYEPSKPRKVKNGIKARSRKEYRHVVV
jgi:hypothetical protein